MVKWEPAGGRLRELDEAQLLEQCRWEAFRASGPGGQKRNKTSSAVRITHEATGISAIANESRSQAENRRRALRRLRHRLALELRRPVDLEGFVAPDWLLDGGGKWLGVSLRNERYAEVMGMVLDVLAGKGWSVSEAAQVLGGSTSGLIRFLAKDPALWAEVNRQRQFAGLRILVMRE